MGTFGTQKYTSSVCILFSVIELLLYTVVYIATYKGCLNGTHFTTLYTS